MRKCIGPTRSSKLQKRARTVSVRYYLTEFILHSIMHILQNKYDHQEQWKNISPYVVWGQSFISLSYTTNEW